MKRVIIPFRDTDKSIINEVKEVLLQGGVVALPSETVYGLAALAGNRAAVEKLSALKRRPQDKYYTYHFSSVAAALNALAILPPYGYRLAERFWPGPLTIIYDDPGGGKKGVRVPGHPFLLELLDALGQPLFLPSANRSGEREALSADEVEAYFGDSLDMIVDGSAPSYFMSSTVIDLTYHPFKIVREGAVSVRDILDQYIRKRVVFVCTGNTCRSVMAEYLLKRYLAEYDPMLLERYEVISRGTGAVDGNPLSPEVQTLLEEESVFDGQMHRSRSIDRETVLSADLIFTMEARQKEYIVRMEPSAESRVFHLDRFLPPEQEGDITDPIGTSEKVYRNVFETIQTAVKELRDWL